MMDKILFTGNAYIKKNSKEIIDILLDSGYIKSKFFLEHEPYIFIDAGRIYSTGSFFDDDKFGLNCFPYGINCLDNLDFFLAIAMMRKDTDKNQWFISTYNNQDIWFISDYDDVNEMKSPYNIGLMQNVRKATINEIINKFATDIK